MVTATAHGPRTPAAGRPGGRIESIDLVRGLVIVLMALDHARVFFGPAAHSPEDLSQASAALFLTRWVTHLCAPVFVLLAGLGARLYELGAGRERLTRFLLTRGLWLVALEILIVNPSWGEPFYNGMLFVQVIWVLGVSMIVLAGLVRWPRWAIGGFGFALVVGHHLADGIAAKGPDGWGPLWALVHEQTWFALPGGLFFVVVYPLIPWIGVMALGYLLGDVYLRPVAERRRWLLVAGGLVTLAFVVVRGINLYADPSPWAIQERGPLFTLLSFLNTTKYPPSLAFLGMTLGPGLLLLAAFERSANAVDRAAPGGSARNRTWLGRAMIVYGRVPLFFYLLHVPVLHLAAAGWSLARYGAAGWWTRGPSAWPPGYEHSLVPVYVAWLVVTAALLPVSAAFARLKRRNPGGLLRYL